MDKRQFSEQIAAAITELGAEAAAGCMARSLLYLAHTAGDDLEFTCDQGVVAIERQQIPDHDKH